MEKEVGGGGGGGVCEKPVSPHLPLSIFFFVFCLCFCAQCWSLP